MSAPLLSYIVLVYNYERYIGQAIRSILDQTVQDFEIIVVDDGSTDRSRSVVESFGDPRIRLLVNPRNLGGGASYNRAVEAATGEYLVNLDADDWVAPGKSEQQLRYLRQNGVAVLGTYVTFVDSEGMPHPRAAELTNLTNRPFELNTIDAWVGTNSLCRSSTMVSRAAHMKVGLDDPTMARACDYDLWTRFLRAGFRFAVVPEPLTFYRLHSRGVTFADPAGLMLELCYAMIRNLLPLIETRAAYPSLVRMIGWIRSHEMFAAMRPVERYRLLGCVLMSPALADFASFHRLLQDESADAALVAAGRRALALTSLAMEATEVHKLRSDVAAYVESRDFWHSQSDAWEAEVRKLLAAQPALPEPQPPEPLPPQYLPARLRGALARRLSVLRPRRPTHQEGNPPPAQ